MQVFLTTMPSPVGPLTLHSNGDALTGVEFPEPRYPLRIPLDAKHDPGPFKEVVAQLEQYFAGERRVFTVPVAPSGTEFQQLVWAALQTIPFGETWSYGQLAAAISKPNASRAVGAANGKNPVSVVIPCHRVIGSSGELTGFGGGLPRKRYLLELEGSLVPTGAKLF